MMFVMMVVVVMVVVVGLLVFLTGGKDGEKGQIKQVGKGWFFLLPMPSNGCLPNRSLALL